MTSGAFVAEATVVADEEPPEVGEVATPTADAVAATAAAAANGPPATAGAPAADPPTASAEKGAGADSAPVRLAEVPAADPGIVASESNSTDSGSNGANVDVESNGASEGDFDGATDGDDAPPSPLNASSSKLPNSAAERPTEDGRAAAAGGAALNTGGGEGLDAVPRMIGAISASGPSSNGSNGSRGSSGSSGSRRAAAAVGRGAGVGAAGISGPASLRGSKGARDAASIMSAVQPQLMSSARIVLRPPTTPRALPHRTGAPWSPKRLPFVTHVSLRARDARLTPPTQRQRL